MSKHEKKQKVVILGGGFAGIKAALDLSEDVHHRFEISLVSNQPNFRYYPALYRTATGGAVAGASIPLKDLFEGKPVTVIEDEAVSLDRKAKQLQLSKSAVPFDTLVIGLGVVTNYFGIPGMEENSYGIKSFEAITKFKQHIHQQLEDDRRADLNYVIVGAGPTGIELAGALPEYIKKLQRYHGLKSKPVHVDLIEAGPRLLPRMPKATGVAVTRRLKALGVKIYTKQAVQGVAGDHLTVSGKDIKSHTVVWTAGTTTHPFFKANNFILTPRGKVDTNMYLEAEDSIYVIGDNANTPFSGMAQTALHDGVYVAESIKRRAGGRNPKSYVVKQPITVIPVGEYWATVLWGSLKLNGLIGWALRELADFMAFIDYEPWWKAGRQWLLGWQEEETCKTCLQAMKRELVDN